MRSRAAESGLDIATEGAVDALSAHQDGLRGLRGRAGGRYTRGTTAEAARTFYRRSWLGTSSRDRLTAAAAAAAAGRAPSARPGAPCSWFPSRART